MTIRKDPRIAELTAGGVWVPSSGEPSVPMRFHLGMIQIKVGDTWKSLAWEVPDVS